MRRLLALLLLGTLLPGCAATALLGYQLRPDFPDDGATETLKLTGLSGPVHVTFDALGVPHVEAETDVDLARAHGYVQARARYFQMDLMRRLARGRVSELVGEQPLVSSTTVDYDRVMRGWDLEGHATAGLAHLTPTARATLEAFADGANQALARHAPIEYRLLGLTPEPWTPGDSLAVGLLNVWSITHNYQQELTRLLLAMHGGVARMNALYPSEPMRGARTITAAAPGTRPLPPSVAEELEGLFPSTLTAPRAEADFPVETLTSGGASNSWVVSGAHTRSGKPMVANDPHLTHLLPSIFVQVHLKGPGLDVIGATVPGLPWVLTGHNARVAWGMTSAMADVTDLVLEQPDQARPGFVRHEGDDCPLTERHETLRVRHGGRLDEATVTFRATCHGPLLNDLLPRLLPPGAPLVAVQWRVSGIERSLDVLLAMNRADSVEAFGRAVAELPSPSNTWNVADVDGHLGSFVSGEVPLRPHHRGTFPVPGWSAKYEWTEWAQGLRLPHVVDPPSGLLAHANNTMLDPTASDAERLHVDAAPPYRVERILQVLAATPKHDLASFQALFVDVFSARGQLLTPYLLAALGDGATFPALAQQARSVLAAWDFEALASGPHAAIFFMTYRFALEEALADELPPDAVRFFLAQRYSTATADEWFFRADHPVWDDRRTPAVEGRDEVLRHAFLRAVDALAAAQGADASRWQWGALHGFQPRHAFGGQAVLEGTFNLPRLAASGELDTVWKSHFDLGNEQAPFKVVAGPAYRSVVDLGDVEHGWWTLDTGASGWPKSPHYGDQYEAWKRGALLPMLMNLDEVRRGVHGELTLVP